LGYTIAVVVCVMAVITVIDALVLLVLLLLFSNSACMGDEVLSEYDL